MKVSAILSSSLDLKKAVENRLRVGKRCPKLDGSTPVSPAERSGRAPGGRGHEKMTLLHADGLAHVVLTLWVRAPRVVHPSQAEMCHFGAGGARVIFQMQSEGLPFRLASAE